MPSGVYIRTEQTKINMSIAQKAVGRTSVPVNCKNTGRTRFKKGMQTWNKGKKLTEEHKARLKLAKVGYMPNHTPTIMYGERNYMWKGDQVSYRTLHKWVERHLGKANNCSFNENHVSTRYHWANVSGMYMRELGDWIQACPSCNRKMNIKINERFIEGRQIL